MKSQNQKNNHNFQDKNSFKTKRGTKFLLGLFLLLIFALLGRPRVTFFGKVEDVERIKVHVYNYESRIYDEFYMTDTSEIQQLYNMLLKVPVKKRRIETAMYGEGDGRMNFHFEFKGKEDQYIEYRHEDYIIISLGPIRLKSGALTSEERILYSRRGIPEVIAIKEYIYSLMENAQDIKPQQ